MKKNILLLLTIFFIPIFISLKVAGNRWIINKQNGYTIFYTTKDYSSINNYKNYFEKGKESVTDFFQSPFYNEFNIYIHPTRESLDSTWQKDWNMPGFKSQCWMVASGIAEKLDIISPKMWDSLACEHSYADSIETQNIITHELFHVFHGQQNESPDFSNITGIDWFVEGLATYASGQCDTIRISEVQKALLGNDVPETLNGFWSGNLRYGLSGTVMMYIDNQYGREKLFSLLKYNNLEELLISLGTTESEIIVGWRKFINEL